MDLVAGSSMNEPKRDRRGRPRKPEDERRSHNVRIRLTEGEKYILWDIALDSGQTFSEWCRRKLLAGVFNERGPG